MTQLNNVLPLSTGNGGEVIWKMRRDTHEKAPAGQRYNTTKR